MDEKVRTAPDVTRRQAEPFLRLAIELANLGCMRSLVVTLSDEDFRRVFWPRPPMAWSADGDVPSSFPRLTLEQIETTEVRLNGPTGVIVVKREKP